MKNKFNVPIHISTIDYIDNSIDHYNAISYTLYQRVLLAGIGNGLPNTIAGIRLYKIKTK
jgi:hypothetical protein